MQSKFLGLEKFCIKHVNSCFCLFCCCLAVADTLCGPCIIPSLCTGRTHHLVFTSRIRERGEFLWFTPAGKDVVRGGWREKSSWEPSRIEDGNGAAWGKDQAWAAEVPGEPRMSQWIWKKTKHSKCTLFPAAPWNPSRVPAELSRLLTLSSSDTKNMLF